MTILVARRLNRGQYDSVWWHEGPIEVNMTVFVALGLNRGQNDGVGGTKV